MDIESKYRIVEKIFSSNDVYMLNEIKPLLNLSETDFWDELPEKARQDIVEAMQQLDNGLGRSHTTVMAEIRKHFGITGKIQTN